MKTIFFKFEWAFLLFSLAMVATFVPMLISAASTLSFITGVAVLVAFVLWLFSYILRINETTLN